MIINYNIPTSSFVDSDVIIEDISRPYWVEDEESRVYDVYYAFSGRAIDHIEFTVDANVNLYTKGAIVEVVALTGMGANYFAFHLNAPWYRYIPEEGDPDTMILQFNGSVFTDNPHYIKDFRFRINIDGCQTATYCLVSYNSNGADSGATPASDFECILGDTITILPNTGYLQKENIDFIGWNTESDGSGTRYIPGEQIQITSNTTLFAMWGEAQALVFESKADNTVVGLSDLSTYQEQMEYSLDTFSWSKFTPEITISLRSNQRLYVRGILGNDLPGDGGGNGTTFSVTGNAILRGNCNYLWNYNDISAPLKKYCGKYLFSNCLGLTSAEKLLLPSLDLSEGAYYCMFDYCSNLTKGPSLPATGLSYGSYAGMFRDTSLGNNLPHLPAKNLPKRCYWGMFQYANISKMATMDAEIVGEESLMVMYRACPIQTVGGITAHTFGRYACHGMFLGCTSLTEVQKLPVLNLDFGSCEKMFMDCTSLETVHCLPADTLMENSYCFMFYRCSSLKFIKCLAINGINELESTYRWVEGVQTNSGIFVRHPSATNWTRDVNGIPNGEGWVEQTATE